MSSNLYFGLSDKIPKNLRRANMKEALEHNQVRFFGKYKVDPKLLAYYEANKGNKGLTVISLRKKLIPLRGLLKKQEETIKKNQTKGITNKKLQTDYTNNLNKYNNLAKKYTMMMSTKKPTKKPLNINEVVNKTEKLVRVAKKRDTNIKKIQQNIKDNIKSINDQKKYNAQINKKQNKLLYKVNKVITNAQKAKKVIKKEQSKKKIGTKRISKKLSKFLDDYFKKMEKQHELGNDLDSYEYDLKNSYDIDEEDDLEEYFDQINSDEVDEYNKLRDLNDNYFHNNIMPLRVKYFDPLDIYISLYNNKNDLIDDLPNSKKKKLEMLIK